MAEYQPLSRRPIADVFRCTAHSMVHLCVRLEIHPDLVSYASIVAAVGAGVCFWRAQAIPALLLVAVVLCYVRLWLNMLDGTIKESKLFDDAKQLLKIFSGVRFAQTRGVGGHQYTEIMFHVVIAAALRIFGMEGQKCLVRFASIFFRSGPLDIAKSDLLALVWHPY